MGRFHLYCPDHKAGHLDMWLFVNLKKMRYIGNNLVFLEKQEKIGYGYHLCQKQSLISPGPGLQSMKPICGQLKLFLEHRYLRDSENIPHCNWKATPQAIKKCKGIWCPECRNRGEKLKKYKVVPNQNQRTLF